MGTPPCILTIFLKGDNFCDFLFAFLVMKPSHKGSSLKGKNLLLVEQIRSFKSWPQKLKEAKMKMVELLSR